MTSGMAFRDNKYIKNILTRLDTNQYKQLLSRANKYVNTI